MITIDDILVFLDERLATAKSDWEESHEVAPNSYGAGYDRGYLDAIKEFRKFVNGEE